MDELFKFHNPMFSFFNVLLFHPGLKVEAVTHD